MLKLKFTNMSFMKADLGGEELHAPIFVSEDGDYFLNFTIHEAGEDKDAYYLILTPLIHGSPHTMRFHNPPILSSDVEIVDDFV